MDVKRALPVAAPVLLILLVVPWLLYFKELSRPEPEPNPAPKQPVPPGPDLTKDPGPKIVPPTAIDQAKHEAAELLAKDPLDFRGLALKAAADEAARLAEYEAKLQELGDGLLVAEAHRNAARWGSVIDILERLLASFPSIELAVLDAAGLQWRVTHLKLRMRKLLSEAKVAFLELQGSSPSPQEESVRSGMVLRYRNEGRECARQLEEMALKKAPDPAPRKVVAKVGGPEVTAKQETEQKIRSIRLSVDFYGKTVTEALDFLRELTGLNFVVRNPEAALRPLAFKLNDVGLDAILEQVAQGAGLTWEVDAFGIVQLASKP